MTATIICNRCHASITTPSLAEAIQWSDRHDDLCTADMNEADVEQDERDRTFDLLDPNEREI